MSGIASPLTTALVVHLLSMPISAVAGSEDARWSAAVVAVGDALLERQGEHGTFFDPPGGPSPWQGGPLLEDWQHVVHADACGALFELYALTHEERFRRAAERGLWHLGSVLETPTPEEVAGFEPTAVRKVGDRLDATAATLLAALEWLRLTPPPPGAATEAALASPRAVARYLLARQVEEPEAPDLGAFRPPSIYPWPTPRIPGLATLALARLAALDPGCRDGAPCPWRRSAVAGAGWIMAVRDLGKDFDHLPQESATLLALDALHRDDPAGGDSYFLHARRIGDGMLRRQSRDSYPGILRRAEWAVGLAAVLRISARSGTDDAPRFRQGALDAAVVLRDALGNPTQYPVSDLRRILPALMVGWKLDSDADPW